MIIKETTGLTNVFANEPPISYTEDTMHNVKAELLNGRVAMIAVMGALINYAYCGQLLPGIW